MTSKLPLRQQGPSRRWHWIMMAFLAIGAMGASGLGPLLPLADSSSASAEWRPFSFLGDEYLLGEKIALIANVLVAIAGLAYALSLIKQVYGADTGTPRMQEITK